MSEKGGEQYNLQNLTITFWQQEVGNIWKKRKWMLNFPGRTQTGFIKEKWWNSLQKNSLRQNKVFLLIKINYVG